MLKGGTMITAENYFQRAIRDVKIHGRVLTPSEINRLYFLYRWYYLRWWQRLWLMVKETWFILTHSEKGEGFDFWWTPYNRIVCKMNREWYK